MVVGFEKDSEVDQVFHALSNSTRRQMLRRTMRVDLSVSALARHYPMSFAAVQKHVAVLESAELVRKRPSGREQIVSAEVDAIEDAKLLLQDLEDLWRTRLDTFEQTLNEL